MRVPTSQGNAWVQVWLSGLLDEHPGQTLRVAPLVHSGELLGLIVCVRALDKQPFSEEEERVITELARQVALALHNSALDTALQASLDELRIANDELQASRARIVATADQSRRQIERNLHDGAQQHLVALAVKLGLARQLVDGDREALGTLLEELRADAQTTLTELRELAHGIYPPLLMDRGLPEALRAAANRSALATDVDAEVGRFPAEVEAAVYFCCLEALQNAGKHAGEDRAHHGHGARRRSRAAFHGRRQRRGLRPERVSAARSRFRQHDRPLGRDRRQPDRRQRAGPAARGSAVRFRCQSTPMRSRSRTSSGRARSQSSRTSAGPKSSLCT